ncbi:MAG: ABC transporter, partial [bacterium]|nr:ABC transporter [bacterium]
LSGQFGSEILTSSDDELLIAVANGSEALPSVLTTVEASGADIRKVTLERPTLETLFLKLTGRELRD